VVGGFGYRKQVSRRLSALDTSNAGNLLHTPVIAYEDHRSAVFRVSPAPASLKNGKNVELNGVGNEETLPPGQGLEKTLTTRRQKIPRPPNAFILYRQHYHPFVKAANPEFHNNDISVLLGKQWKAESPQKKAEYKALAEEKKRKHAEEFPNYQYAPRKPSEKKRRSQRRHLSEVHDNGFISSENFRDLPAQPAQHYGPQYDGNSHMSVFTDPGPVNVSSDTAGFNNAMSISHHLTFGQISEMSTWSPYEYDPEHGGYANYMP
ncbi:hypothetical protein KEM55_005141, partial [Ascosphaera atra]